MEPDPQHVTITPDFVRAAILRALGARLIKLVRDPHGRAFVHLDLSGVMDSLEHTASTLLREVHAAAALPSPKAAADCIVDGTFLTAVSGHLSDLKRRA